MYRDDASRHLRYLQGEAKNALSAEVLFHASTAAEASRRSAMLFHTRARYGEEIDRKERGCCSITH
jgi:hypothetical protein